MQEPELFGRMLHYQQDSTLVGSKVWTVNLPTTSSVPLGELTTATDAVAAYLEMRRCMRMEEVEFSLADVRHGGLFWEIGLAIPMPEGGDAILTVFLTYPEGAYVAEYMSW